jgi:hypothetical protein
LVCHDKVDTLILIVVFILKNKVRPTLLSLVISKGLQASVPSNIKTAIINLSELGVESFYSILQFMIDEYYHNTISGCTANCLRAALPEKCDQFYEKL